MIKIAVKRPGNRQKTQRPMSLLWFLRHFHVRGLWVTVTLVFLSSLVLAAAINLQAQILATSSTIALAELIHVPKRQNPNTPFGRLLSVDVMKLTKDAVANQPGDAEIASVISVIAGQIHATHIAVSVPLDPSADYPAGQKPFPRSAEDFTQAWADAIHKTGAKVLWRGTWAGIEGLYGFSKSVGANRFPAGTAASAASDGNSTWLGKIYGYIVSNPQLFEDGDIWAPLPERTENIFSDETSFLPYSDSTVQATYANFFIDLKTVSDRAFAEIGKKVTAGMSSNNFSEAASGWLKQSIFNSAGIVAVDYYGTDHTPSEMDVQLRAISRKTGHPVFLEEWSDYFNGGLDPGQRIIYLKEMYAVFQKLADDNVLAGFNYWGGWPKAAESVIDASGGSYALNPYGKILAAFYAANNRPAQSQVIRP